MRGICPPCQSRGGAFVNFALPVGRAFANPGATPSFRHARGFLSKYNYTEDFTGKKQADWLIFQGREKIEDVCKGMSSILCMHFFIAYEARIT